MPDAARQRWFQFTITAGVLWVAWLALAFACVRGILSIDPTLSVIGFVVWCIVTGFLIVRKSARVDQAALYAGGAGGFMGTWTVGLLFTIQSPQDPSAFSLLHNHAVAATFFLAFMVGLFGALIGGVLGTIMSWIRKWRKSRIQPGP